MSKLLENGLVLTYKEVDDMDLEQPPIHLQQLNVKNAWEHGITGAGVKVAVLDTGCDINNPLLKDKITRVYNFTSDDNGDSENVTDYVGHGTQVASLIASENFHNKVIGVAPDVELFIYKVKPKDGLAKYEWIARGIYASAQNGADFINLSLNGETASPQIYEAIKFAYNMNCLVVCSSGNEGDGDSSTNEYLYPSCYPEVVQVSAIDDDYNITDFSNSNEFVDCVANGNAVLGLGLEESFYALSGTSQATPIVTGALALIKQWARTEYNRELTSKELYALLVKNTKSLKGVSRNMQGHGFVHLNLFENE